MAASELPQDLVVEILLRIPAKSIGRFRSVSKPWRSLLTSPKFMKSHRDFLINGGAETSIIVPVSSDDGGEDNIPPHLLIINFAGSSRKVTSPFFIGKSIVLHAVCHGFVLVELDNAILVFNPLTLEVLEVPEAKLYHYEHDNHGRISHYGLGYDSSTDDYKIVRLLNYNRDSPRREFDGKYVEVYSLKMKSWRRIMSIPYKHHDLFRNHVLFVNGRLHWKSWSNEGYVIVAFNLASEKFEQISPPTKAFCRDGSPLTVFGGCLAVVSISVHYCDVDNVNIWVMREYGVQESWTKVVVDTKGGREGEFVCVSGEDELVFAPYANGNPANFSLSTGVWREWDLSAQICFEDVRVLPIAEFLLSPEKISN